MKYCREHRIEYETQTCYYCDKDAARRAEIPSEETLRSSAWVEALERAKTALRAVLNCDQSMSRAELAIACQEVSDMMDGELRDAKASTHAHERPANNPKD